MAWLVVNGANNNEQSLTENKLKSITPGVVKSIHSKSDDKGSHNRRVKMNERNPERKIAIAILIPFTLLTLYTIFDVGYLGIFEYHIHSSAGWKVITDLVIACLLILMWLVPNAKQCGRNPWPYVAITLTFGSFGSFGPLLYLLLGKKQA
jgi:hypothetical protein